MVERLNTFADGFVAAAVSQFVQLAVLAALIGLLDLALRRRVGPTWRCALWTLFLLKLVLPPQLAAPTSPAYWWRHHHDNPVRPMPVMQPMPAAPSDQMWDTAMTAVTSPERTPVPLPKTPARLSWRSLVFLGWASGVLALWSATALRHRELRRRLRKTAPAPDWLTESLGRAARQTGIRTSATVVVLEEDLGPFVLGLLRPVVYVPRSFVERLTREQLYAILVHELCHVRRGDLWIAAAQSLLRGLYFPHPVVWWVNRHLERLREQATDEAVLDQPDVTPRSYSLALVEAAAVLGGASPSRFALGVIDQKSQLKKRIQMNLHHPRAGRARLGLPGLGLLALLAFVLIPMAPAEGDGAASPAPSAFKSADAGPFLKRIDTATTKIMDAFNRRDREAYLTAFAPDALILPPGAPLIDGTSGVAQMFLQLPPKFVYEPIVWGARDVYAVDRWLIETGEMSFQFRIAPDAALMNEPRQTLSIWEEGNDGNLKVKLLAWNRLGQPDRLKAPPVAGAFRSTRGVAPTSAQGDFAAVLKAEETFHHLIEQDKLQEAAAYYDEGATLIVPNGVPARGKAAITAQILNPGDGAKCAKIDREVVHLEGNANHVLVVNLFRWMITPPDGGAPFPIVGKGVHVWQREADGAWRIVFDLPNSSQPTG